MEKEESCASLLSSIIGFRVPYIFIASECERSKFTRIFPGRSASSSSSSNGMVTSHCSRCGVRVSQYCWLTGRRTLIEQHHSQQVLCLCSSCSNASPSNVTNPRTSEQVPFTQNASAEHKASIHPSCFGLLDRELCGARTGPDLWH